MAKAAASRPGTAREWEAHRALVFTGSRFGGPGACSACPHRASAATRQTQSCPL